MSSGFILTIIVAYFLLLLVVAHITGKKASNTSFFSGDKNAKWYIVAFGMIGTSLSGVTFISVPGAVGSGNFEYMQVVFGYLVGYFIIALVLMPLYYRLQLTSIYQYLADRFGNYSYKTGAIFFLISRILGASFRLYLVASVLQTFVLGDWGISFEFTVFLSILFIWIYTHKGGIKTIIWTDTLQTLFMLLAVGFTIVLICRELDWSFATMISEVSSSSYAHMINTNSILEKGHFIKQFIGGIFIAICMTGLDQDMMQKNLSCKNIKEAKWNMISFSTVLVVVNLVFLCLGALLFLYAQAKGLNIPEKTDQLYPLIALQSGLGKGVGVLFILGLIAAAYSSADSALTALTTSFCYDILGAHKKGEKHLANRKKWVHIGMSVMLFIVMVVFNRLTNKNVISELLTVASYSYGPLLGLYAVGMFTKWKPKDALVPLVCIAAPIASYFISTFIAHTFGYVFSYELLVLNGLITSVGLYVVSTRYLGSTEKAINN
ncbi:MAG: SSS family transporter [Flavobacteriales bacterium]|jgi:SSS family transporter